MSIQHENTKIAVEEMIEANKTKELARMRESLTRLVPKELSNWDTYVIVDLIDKHLNN